MIQNVSPWIWYRMSPNGGPTDKASHNVFDVPKRKLPKYALEEEKKLNKLRRAETLNDQKQAKIDQKAADKLRKLKEEKDLKQMKEENKAEKQRRKDEEVTRKRLEREQIEAEKQHKKEEELASKRTKSEEKERAKELKKQEELDLKRVKMLKKEKKIKLMEEKEGQTKENEELDIPEAVLEEECNTIQPDINAAATPMEIDPKAIPPSVNETMVNPPSSSKEQLLLEVLSEN